MARHVAAEHVGEQVRVMPPGRSLAAVQISSAGFSPNTELAESALAVTTTQRSPRGCGGARSSRRVARGRRRPGVVYTSIQPPPSVERPDTATGRWPRSAAATAIGPIAAMSTRFARPKPPHQHYAHPAAPVTDAPSVEAVRGGPHSVSDPQGPADAEDGRRLLPFSQAAARRRRRAGREAAGVDEQQQRGRECRVGDNAAANVRTQETVRLGS